MTNRLSGLTQERPRASQRSLRRVFLASWAAIVVVAACVGTPEPSLAVVQAQNGRQLIAVPRTNQVDWLTQCQDRCGGWGVLHRSAMAEYTPSVVACTLAPNHEPSAYLTGLALYALLNGRFHSIGHGEGGPRSDVARRAVECIVSNNWTSCSASESNDDRIKGVATSTMALCAAIGVGTEVIGARSAAEAGVGSLSSALHCLPWNRVTTPTRSGLEMCVWSCFALLEAKRIGIDFDEQVVNRIGAYVDGSFDATCGFTFGSGSGRRVNNYSAPLFQTAHLASHLFHTVLDIELSDVDEFRLHYCKLWLKDYFDSTTERDALGSELDWLLAGYQCIPPRFGRAPTQLENRLVWVARTTLIWESGRPHQAASKEGGWSTSAMVPLNEAIERVAILAMIRTLFTAEQDGVMGQRASDYRPQAK